MDRAARASVTLASTSRPFPRPRNIWTHWTRQQKPRGPNSCFRPSDLGQSENFGTTRASASGARSAAGTLLTREDSWRCTADWGSLNTAVRVGVYSGSTIRPPPCSSSRSGRRSTSAVDLSCRISTGLSASQGSPPSPASTFWMKICLVRPTRRTTTRCLQGAGDSISVLGPSFLDLAVTYQCNGMTIYLIDDEEFAGRADVLHSHVGLPI